MLRKRSRRGGGRPGARIVARRVSIMLEYGSREISGGVFHWVIKARLQEMTIR